VSLLERKARRVSTGDGIVTVASLVRASVAFVVLIALLTKVGMFTSTTWSCGDHTKRRRSGRHCL
jgi:hypothetical protein